MPSISIQKYVFTPAVNYFYNVWILNLSPRVATFVSNLVVLVEQPRKVKQHSNELRRDKHDAIFFVGARTVNTLRMSSHSKNQLAKFCNFVSLLQYSVFVFTLLVVFLDFCTFV